MTLIRFVNPIVKFLYSVLLSVGAIFALVFVPPAGMLLLLTLYHHLSRGARGLRAPM